MFVVTFELYEGLNYMNVLDLFLLARGKVSLVSVNCSGWSQPLSFSAVPQTPFALSNSSKYFPMSRLSVTSRKSTSTRLVSIVIFSPSSLNIAVIFFWMAEIYTAEVGCADIGLLARMFRRSRMIPQCRQNCGFFPNIAIMEEQRTMLYDFKIPGAEFGGLHGELNGFVEQVIRYN